MDLRHFVIKSSETPVSLSLGSQDSLLLSWLFVSHCTNEHTHHNVRDIAFNFMNLYDTLQVNNLKKGTPRWLTRLTGFTMAGEGMHSVHGLFLLDRSHFTPFSDKASHFSLSLLIQVERSVQYSLVMFGDGNIL